MAGRGKRSPGKFRMVLIALALMAMLLVTYRYQQQLRDWFVDDTKYSAEIHAAAARHGLPPELVRSLVFRESRFNPEAVGSAGEIGLMQVLPQGAVAEWAKRNGKAMPTTRELMAPALNLEIGCSHLARAMQRWRNYRFGTELALAQYNAGESRAARWKPDNPQSQVVGRIGIPSTRAYVENIMTRYRHYQEAKR